MRSLALAVLAFIGALGLSVVLERGDAAPAPAVAERGGPRQVAILVYEGVELLDFAGPGEVFAASGRRAFEVYTVGETAAPVLSQRFVTVTPRYSIAEAPRPDVLVVPGGDAGNLMSAPMLAWIRATAKDAEVVLSVCNGALVLAEAGLLDGLGATTHHGSLDSLRRMAPTATVHADRRFVDNGRVVTAAGVSAGIDAALHVVRRLAGDDAARRTARYMEYDWREGDPAATRSAP